MNNVLDCVEVKMHFPVGKGALLHAVDDVSFFIGQGESIGLVGAATKPTKPRAAVRRSTV